MKPLLHLALLLAVAAAAPGLSEEPKDAQPHRSSQSPVKLAVLAGLWQSDLASSEGQRHVRAYLQQGRELQLKYCGVAWPESEIDRRLSVLSRDIVQWRMDVTGGGKALLRMVSGPGKPSRITVLAFCEPAADAMLKCKVLCPENEEDCRPGDEYLRLEGSKLYVFAPIRKSQMQCAAKETAAEEVSFVSPFYLEKLR